MKQIKIFMIPRAQDEEVLAWLRMRQLGQNSTRIARAFNQDPAHVRSCMNRVIKADLAESGEPPETVKGAYA